MSAFDPKRTFGCRTAGMMCEHRMVATITATIPAGADSTALANELPSWS